MWTSWSRWIQVGDPVEEIVSGTTQITKSARTGFCIAEDGRPVPEEDAGIMREGFSFQAGAGGIALAFVDYLGAR